MGKSIPNSTVGIGMAGFISENLTRGANHT